MTSLNPAEKFPHCIQQSMHSNFYDEDSSNNHDTLAKNNTNYAYISKNVNDVESAIRHNEITIHPNSNFDNVTDANFTATNEASEINNISEVTILNDLMKECNLFLERVYKFNSNIEKRKQEPDKLDDDIKTS